MKLLIEAFNVLNFERVAYKDKKGETRLMFHLNHDAFALLVMGFTGEKAFAWKWKFIESFRAMEAELMALKDREAYKCNYSSHFLSLLITYLVFLFDPSALQKSAHVNCRPAALMDL